MVKVGRQEVRGLLLRREKVAAALRSVDWAGLGVRWAVLFGSVAARGAGGDVDLLVAPSGRGGAEWRLEVALAVADAIGVDWGRVDVVEAGTDTPCPIVFDAWKHGVVVYEERRGAAREWLLTRVMICSDYVLAAERLGVVEAAVRAVARRWGRIGGTG